MKKTQTKNQLSLRSETLRALSAAHLGQAGGGRSTQIQTITAACPSVGTYTCYEECFTRR